MDLSGAFHSIMKALFPNASIIADKFNYVRLIRTGMVNSRLNTCSSLKDRALAKSIKKNLHLFDKYQKNLDNEKQWFDHHLKKYFTCQTYIEYIFDLEETEEFYKNYKIYQDFLKIVHEPHSSYKDILNEWFEYIFDTKNEHYVSIAKSIRKRWFMPIIKSLTYNAYYIRGQVRYKTCFNNGYIESMNNVVKLVKRNAHGFRYFDNLRKRIFLHLGCKYEFKFKKRKKGTAIAML